MKNMNFTLFQKITLASIPIFFLSVMTLLAQTTISGKVTDAVTGESVLGANIVLKGTSTGTTTDLDGNYTIEVSGEEPILVFSFIGYQSSEVVVGNQTTINVSLKTDQKMLDEVVVVGYGTQKRSEITGSVSSVTAEEITKTPVLRVEQAMQGRTPGVQITQNSGSPGSALTVRIRGIGSTSNSNPLYVVDGVPLGGIDYLNPGDIESIQVLKDAASAAIYGSRGANGVVLITTKQGKKNQRAQINYSGYYGVQSAWKKANLLNATEYAIISNESRRAAGLTPFPEFANPESLGEGTDWQGAIFEDAPIQNHQLSVTGGSEKSTYALSGNYFKQDGIVGGNKANFERFTIRMNGRYNLTDKFTIGNNLSYTHFSKNILTENDEFNSPVVRALNLDPVTPIRKEDGTFAFSKYSDTDLKNPVNAITLTNDTQTNDRIVGSMYGEYEIIKGLKVKSSYSLDLSYLTRDQFSPTFDLGQVNESNPINSVNKEIEKWSTWLWENTVTYSKVFNEKHNFTFLGGITAQEQRYTKLAGAKSVVPSNDPKNAYLDAATDRGSEAAWGGAHEWGLLSYLGRINYAYDEKYLFSASVRADGSSRFGENNKFATFPSVSLGWVLSEEEFIKSIDVIDFMKFRVSWGQNGNNEIDNYGFTSLIKSNLNYTFGSGETITSGSAPTIAANPDRKWETSTQTDIGLDIGFLNDKITFAADYYIKTTDGLLVEVPIPGHVGTEAPFVNTGSVKNTGWEFAVEYRKGEGQFNYNIGVNGAFIKNEITSLGAGGEAINTAFNQGVGGNISRTAVGHPIASFYGYVTDGIFQNQSEVDAGNQPNASPGDLRFKDLNNDGQINDQDRTFIGNPTPDFTYGINAGASYKNFDFSVFIQGSVGNDIFNVITRHDFSYANIFASRLNRWTGEGSTNTEPRVIVGDPNQNARVSDRFVEDGTYMRVKNMQIGYTVPKELLDKAKIRGCRVYVSGQNLLTFTQYSGLDPEIGMRNDEEPLDIGIDRGFYPQARVFTAGISLDF